MSARTSGRRFWPVTALAATLAVVIAGAPVAHGQAPAPTCTIVDLEHTETDATSLKAWNLECTNPTQTTGSATYRSVEGTARDLGDYIPFGGSLSVPPGLSSRPIAFDLVGDDTGELTEYFEITFDDPDGVVQFRDRFDTEDKSTSRITIKDDDELTVTAVSRSVPEGDDFPTAAEIEITLSDPLDQTLDIDFYTEDGTATDGSDYEGTSVTLTFAPGETSALVAITVSPDLDDEVDESVVLGLRVGFGTEGTVTVQSGVLTIVDDDGASASPCILLSESAVSVSGPASTPTQRGFAGPVQRITMTSCGDADVNVHARGTDATGGSATWELTNLSSGGPIDSICELGIDLFRATVNLWNPQGGGIGTPITTADSVLLGLDGLSAFVLGPEADQEFSADVELPCQGSSGIGQPMSMDVVLTAVEP